MEHQNEKEVMELALQAGHLLLENGAEIFRVEETIERICRYYGVQSENEFVLSNGIFITGGNEREQFFARVQHIPVSGTHLDKVAAVNQLSREIEGKSTRILASGVGSAAFCCLFGGTLVDSLAAFAAGILLYAYLIFFSDRHLSKITGNIGGGLLVTEQLALGIQTGYAAVKSALALVLGIVLAFEIPEKVFHCFPFGKKHF